MTRIASVLLSSVSALCLTIVAACDLTGDELSCQATVLPDAWVTFVDTEGTCIQGDFDEGPYICRRSSQSDDFEDDLLIDNRTGQSPNYSWVGSTVEVHFEGFLPAKTSFEPMSNACGPVPVDVAVELQTDPEWEPVQPTVEFGEDVTPVGCKAWSDTLEEVCILEWPGEFEACLRQVGVTQTSLDTCCSLAPEYAWCE